jgi:hypothetical protein
MTTSPSHPPDGASWLSAPKPLITIDSQLAPSGGWLGEVVILLSKLIGIWDIFALMIIFVVVWVLIRTSA